MGEEKVLQIGNFVLPEEIEDVCAPSDQTGRGHTELFLKLDTR